VIILRLKLNSGHFVDQIFAEIYFALRNLLAFNLRNLIEVAQLIRKIPEVHHQTVSHGASSDEASFS
jgi:hypothetical protein